MTGIPIVNSRITFLYELVVIVCIAGFAAYDFKKRRVPDQALFFFGLFAFIGPFVRMWPYWRWPLLLLFFLRSLTGAAVGFLVLLTAAMLSEGGTGVGGGDIKLAAVMGFIHGASRMLMVLLIASALAVCISLAAGRKRRKERQALPFVPFLMAGNLAVTLAAIL